jgi:hypothetical protein
MTWFDAEHLEPQVAIESEIPRAKARGVLWTIRNFQT